MTYWYPRSVAAVCVALGLAACGAKSPEASLEQARSALASGDRRTAVVLLKSVVQENPNLVEARSLLGKTLLETGDSVGAAAQFDAAIRLGADAQSLALPRVRSQLMQGQFKLALDTLEAMPAAGGGDEAEWHYLRSMALLGLAKPKLAEESVRQALALKPDNGEATLLLARIGLIQGRPQSALDVLGSFKAHQDLEIEKRTLQAIAMVGLGASKPEIRKAYEAVLELAPENIEALTGLAGLHLRDGELEPAKQHLATIKRKHPKDLRGALLNAAVAAREGRVREAREGVAEVLKRLPDDVGALSLAGQIAFQDRDWTMAETHFGKALSLTPDANDLRAMLGRVHLEQGNSEKALATVMPRLNAPTPHGDLLAVAATALLERGQPTQASALFNRALAADQSDEQRLRIAVLQSQLRVGDQGTAVLSALSKDGGDRETALLALISNQLRRGDSSGALGSARQLEQLQPQRAMPLHLQAQIMLSTGDSAGALRQLERGVKLQPDFLPSIHMLAALDLARGAGLAAANARYDGLLQRQPKSIEARLAMADLSLKAGDEAAALEKLKALTADVPNELRGWLALSTHQAVKGRFAEAEREATAGLKHLSDQPQLLDGLGRAQFSAGKHDAALQTFRKLATVQPRSALPLMRQADTLAAKGAHVEASTLLADAARLAPRDPEVRRAQVMLAIGRRNHEAALSQARAMQASAAMRLQGLILEGDVEFARQRWRDAAQVYRRAAELYPDHAEVAIKTHQSLQRLGDKDAEAFAKSWAASNPNSLAFHVHIGNAYAAAGQYAKAEAAYARALAVQPDSPAMANNVAWARLKQGRVDGAELLRTAISKDPLNAELRDTLASVLELSGKPDDAMQAQLEALRLAPSNPGIRLKTVSMLQTRKRADEARKALQAVDRSRLPPALLVEYEQLTQSLPP
jgi:putative PEP-CTERM system TPR-repeat lipoprotein